MNKEYFEMGKIYDAEEVSAYAKFMYYNFGTNHEIYSVGNRRLIFESTEKFKKLRYLGVFLHTMQEDKKKLEEMKI